MTSSAAPALPLSASSRTSSCVCEPQPRQSSADSPAPLILVGLCSAHPDQGGGLPSALLVLLQNVRLRRMVSKLRQPLGAAFWAASDLPPLGQ
eukprot:CAMPEP_0181211976 /NCGR_PEP_ID=MMETSP1096-20121128/24089_1 /TAXON_ID=156174 ORGANISM="Chrysochromulina ericina, Strain CCMP281" /NCGR_SAMPLE_ID=MMETSP1096 /ASSEMBLY_ACC=CAM_ASM_000453 /LENGTH=92 /DNA_ID=CAMNT_0023303445 /DNA_START=512 /DNA_END=787 /DNA_ORIENTATION=-